MIWISRGEDEEFNRTMVNLNSLDTITVFNREDGKWQIEGYRGNSQTTIGLCETKEEAEQVLDKIERKIQEYQEGMVVYI